MRVSAPRLWQVAVRERMLSEGASAEEADRALELAEAISDFIRSKSLAPTLRTEYFRTAFQLSTSNAVRRCSMQNN